MYQKIIECNDKVTYKDLADICTSKLSIQNWKNNSIHNKIIDSAETFGDEDNIGKVEAI